MVEVFREIRRVLRKDGTLWLNLGDSFATGAGKVGEHPGGGEQGERWKGNRGTHTPENSGKAAPRVAAMGPMTQPNRMPLPGLKPKDMCGIPWRVALALQANGWWLRSDIIWQKLNPLPESVQDRPTRSHEYIFLLTKSAHYYYDAEAIKEKATYPAGPNSPESIKSPYGQGFTRRSGNKERVLGDGRGRPGSHLGSGIPWEDNGGGRNKRSVWAIAVQAFLGAHFSVYPEALVEPCILAGTSEKGCCAKCGAPWKRIVEKTGGATGKGWHDHKDDLGQGQQSGSEDNPRASANGYESDYRVRTVGWEPSCSCGIESLRPDDLEMIHTPTGEAVGPDPTLSTGRKGMNRPRGAGEGKRGITRYEQRQYAKQLKTNPHRAEMEKEAGTAFVHYARTDKAGARPIPPDLLDAWMGRGWMTRVTVPERIDSAPVPCIVLDPFMGSGTTGVVAVKARRNFIGIELNPQYAEMARARIAPEMAQLRLM